MTNYNSEEFQTPEFSVEVATSFGKVTIESYTVGNGFVLEHPMITPVCCISTADLPAGLEACISKLEHAHDTMT